MKSQRHRRGAIIVWAAISFPVLLMLVGFVCDTGYVSVASDQLRTISDASALAGAQALLTDPSSVHQKAKEIAFANRLFNRSMVIDDSDIVVGHYNRIPSGNPGFQAGVLPYNAVKVSARNTSGSPMGPLPLIFGPIVGVNYSNVSCYSIAMISKPGPSVIVLDPTAPGALTLTGSGNFNVTGGTVYVNSNSASAVLSSGGGGIFADGLDIVGQYKKTGPGTLPQNISVNAASTQDPYASLAAPPVPANVTPNGNVYSPGHYPQGIQINGPGSVIFQPGIYYIDNGIVFAGNGAVTAHNVLFYVNTGAFRINGNCNLDLSPQSSGTWQGITLFQARLNASGSQINGNGKLNLAGGVYIPGGRLTLNGAGSSTGGMVIVKTLSVTGTGSLNVPVGASGGNGIPILVE